MRVVFSLSRIRIQGELKLLSLLPSKLFYRFLRARKFDIVKAKEMLLDCEKWRIEFGVDDIVK